MRIETLSYVKEHANHLELDSPLLITQKGKARFILQNVEDFEYQQETIALLKLLSLSSKLGVENPLTIEQAFSE